jgi:hypothetical protein
MKSWKSFSACLPPRWRFSPNGSGMFAALHCFGMQICKIRQFCYLVWQIHRVSHNGSTHIAETILLALRFMHASIRYIGSTTFVEPFGNSEWICRANKVNCTNVYRYLLCTVYVYCFILFFWEDLIIVTSVPNYNMLERNFRQTTPHGTNHLNKNKWKGYK